MGAMTWTLGPGDGAISLDVDDTSQLGSVAANIITASTGKLDLPRVIRVARDQPRTMPLRVLLGSVVSKDDLHTQIAAIGAWLSAGTTLSFTSTGASNTVTFNILPGSDFTEEWGYSFEMGWSCALDLNLTIEPYAYGAAEVISVPDFTAPGVIDLSTMIGEYPTPLDIDVAVTYPTTGIHSCYMGIVPTSGAAWGGYAQSETPTWTGGTVSAGPTTNASNALSKKNQSTSFATAPIDTSSFPPGPYIVLARAQMISNSDTGTLQLFADAAATLPVTDAVTFANAGSSYGGSPSTATWRFVPVGTVMLPSKAVRGGPAYLYVAMKSSSAVAGHEVATDYWAFVPAVEGIAWYHPASPATEATNDVAVDEDGILYVDSVAASDQGVSCTMITFGSRLCIIAERADGSEPTMALDVTITYTPRYSFQQ